MKTLTSHINETLFKGNIKRNEYKVGDVLYDSSNNPYAICVLPSNNDYDKSARFASLTILPLSLVAPVTRRYLAWNLFTDESRKGYELNNCNYVLPETCYDDMDGYENTYKIINEVKSQVSLNDVHGITDDGRERGLCAAYGCSLFSAGNYGAGKWYLPSLGELKLCYDNFDLLHETINNLKPPVQFILSNVFLTSTLLDKQNVLTFDVEFNEHDVIGLNIAYLVVPFVKVG